MNATIQRAQPFRIALSAAVLLLAINSGFAIAATTANFTTPTTTLSNNAAGASSTYTLSCKLKKKPSGAAIDHLGTVTVTFPGGTNAQTITSGTFQVSGPGSGNGTTTITGMTFPTANTVQFPCPAASGVATNKTITIVLNGVTNALISGSYTASVSAVNTTGGIDSGTNIFSYTLIAGSPTQLAIIQQPTAPIYAGRTITPPPTVAIKDANGNIVTSGTNSTLAVTIAIGTNPGGTLSGTKTVNAVAGIATFSTLSIDTIHTGYTLHATQGALTPADTNAFDVIAAPPDFLVFSTQPTNVTAGTTFTVAVTVKDGVTGLTNTTTPFSINLSVFSASSGPILLYPGAATTLSASTVSGVATFSNINIHQAGPNGTTASYNLVAVYGAAVPSASSALSNSFNVAPGATVNAVAFLTQPATSQAGSNATTPNPIGSTTNGVPIEVELQDGFGNRVTGASNTITMTLNSGAGTLSGNLTASGGAVGANGTAALAGVAIFDNLNVDLVGAHTLKAALSVSVFSTSTSFQITPAPASALTVTGLSNPSYIGFAADFTITAKDEFGNVDTNYLSVVDITCTDAGATFPTNYQFVAGDQGVHTFTGGVTFATVAASQTLTAADNTDADPANHFSGGQTVQVIKGDTSTTVLTISPNPAGKNEVITLTAQVTGGSFTPTGTVTFKDNGVALTGTAPNATNPANLDGSAKAVMTVAFSATGTHLITATYNGDTKYNPSTSTPAKSLVIVAGTTSTSIARTAGVSPSVYGDSESFTATVTPSTGTPALTGTVDFKEGSTVLASIAVNGSNQAVFTSTALNVGTHSITAVYNGDSNFGQGFGGSVSQVVTTMPITVTADAKSKIYGDADPALTYQVTSGSLVNGDAFSGSLTRVAGETVAGSPYAINQGSLALSSNYALTYAGANFTITARDIEVTAAAKTKIYGNADPALTYSISSGSLAFSDAFSGALTRMAGETVAGSPYAIQQGSLALNSNYNLSFISANLTITTRSVQVTAADKTKIYGDADPALTYTISNGTLAFSDAFTGSLTRAPGETVAGNPYAIQQGTLALDGNYILSYIDANFTITTRAIEVTADAKSKTYGDADPALTYTITGGTLAFSDAFTGVLSRAPGESVGGSPYTIQQGSLALDSNYSLSYISAIFTITARDIEVTADAKTKTYGDADPALTYSITSGTLAFTDAFTGALSRVSGESVAGSPYAIQQDTLSLGSDYNISYIGANFTITARDITVTADAQTKVYGDADPALTYSITSGTLAFSDAFTGVLARVSGETVAGSTYAIQQGTLSLGSNYNLSFVGDDLTITIRDIEVTADAQSKIYGDADPVLSYQITNGSLAFSDAFTGSLTRVSGESVANSPYAIQQGTLALDSNYNLNYVGAIFSISRRPVTVTADAKTKTFGDADPALTYSITSGSLAFSDAFTGALTRVSGESVANSPYAIQQGTLALDGNYTLSYVGANLTITARDIEVTADAKTKTYGDADPALTYSITSGSLAFSDAFTGALTRVSGESVANSPYAIQQGTLALDDNYNLSFISANLTITARNIEVTADAKSKTYGDADPALTYSITSGSLAFLDAFTGSLTRVSGESVANSPYAIQQGTLALDGNYNLSFISANLTITARNIEVTADAKTKTYGDADPALTYSITNGSLAFSDAFTGALTRVSGESVANSPYAIQQGTLTLDSNYNLSFISANFSITARDIEVTADAKTKTYGDADPALTYSITSGSLAFSDAFTGALTRVSGESVANSPYAIQQGTLALDSNYNLTYVSAIFSISLRPVTVTADAKTKTFGSADPALTFQMTSGSLASGDSFSGALTRVSGETVGGSPYTIQQGTLALNANYTLSFVSANLTITKAASSVALASSSNPAAFSSTVTITATVSSSATTPTGTVTFTVDGTPQAPVALTSGSATFSSSTLSVGNHTISASYNGDASYATSSSSPLTQAITQTAAKLAFTAQPTDTNAGSAIAAVKVTVQDSLGNAMTTSATISLAIGTNPAGGTLAGTLSAATSGGVASFSNLSIDKLGSGYTLTASASGLTSATSTTFNIIDSAPPIVVSTITPGATTGVVDQPVTFTFVVSDSSTITYTWDFGDGTVVTTTDTTISHTYTVPNIYPVKVTATDSGGHSTSDQTTFTVNAAATAPGGDICAGLNPIALRVQQVSAKLKFPSTLKKDGLAFKALVDLKDGFNPAGQAVQWEIGGLVASTTLDAKGNSPISTTLKVSLKYKLPKKGQPFTARTGKLSIAMKNQSLSTLTLAGISTLNATTTGTKGQSASTDICVVLTGFQAYHADAVTGTYKAKKDKGGLFAAKFANVR